jgi:hypothetical protein
MEGAAVQAIVICNGDVRGEAAHRTWMNGIKRDRGGSARSARELSFICFKRPRRRAGASSINLCRRWKIGVVLDVGNVVFLASGM